jgi:hypothetical protein
MSLRQRLVEAQQNSAEADRISEYHIAERDEARKQLAVAKTSHTPTDKELGVSMFELEELMILLRSIEGTMLRTYYGAEHTKMLEIANKINKMIRGVKGNRQ